MDRSTRQDQDLNVYPGPDASFQTFPSSTFRRLRPSFPEENLLSIPSPSLPSTYLPLVSSHLWGTVLPRQGLRSEMVMRGAL